MDLSTVGFIIGTVGTFLSLISLFAAYYFYRKSLRLKEPRWAITSNNLIRGYSSKLNELDILYKDHKVENLTISKILFWNRGRDTINRQDIATAEPLVIKSTEEVEILDAKILSNNNESSQISAELENSQQSYLIFDYLDYDQGAIIQIVHTGTSSKDIFVSGKIKSTEIANQDKDSIIPRNKARIFWSLISTPIIVLLLALPVAYVVYSFASLPSEEFIIGICDIHHISISTDSLPQLIRSQCSILSSEEAIKIAKEIEEIPERLTIRNIRLSEKVTANVRALRIGIERSYSISTYAVRPTPSPIYLRPIFFVGVLLAIVLISFLYSLYRWKRFTIIPKGLESFLDEAAV